MKTIIGIAALGVCLTVASVSANAVTVDFSGYTAGTQILGNLIFDDLSFSSTSGTLLIDDYGAGNTICAFDGFGCTATLVLQSIGRISNFETHYSGVDVAGSSILYQGQTALLAFTGRSVADGAPASETAIGIRFPGLTLVSFASDDPNGVGFGKFSFDYASAVPEPASWAFMIGGFFLVGGALRQRGKAISA